MRLQFLNPVFLLANFQQLTIDSFQNFAIHCKWPNVKRSKLTISVHTKKCPSSESLTVDVSSKEKCNHYYVSISFEKQNMALRNRCGCSNIWVKRNHSRLPHLVWTRSKNDLKDFLDPHRRRIYDSPFESGFTRPTLIFLSFLYVQRTFYAANWVLHDRLKLRGSFDSFWDLTRFFGFTEAWFSDLLKKSFQNLAPKWSNSSAVSLIGMVAYPKSI